MIHFFGEVFVTLWPFFLALAMAPMNVVFLFADSSRPSYFILTLLLSQVFFGCLGFVFFFSHLVKLFPNGRKFFAELLPKAKIALFGVFVAVVYLLFSLFAFLAAQDTLSLFIDLGFGWLILMLLVFAGIASTLFYLLKGIVWLGKKWISSSVALKKILAMIGVLLFLYPFFVVITFLVWLLWNPLDGIANYDHHTLHAAVKNTCILDPNKENCPQQLEDIRVIVPEVYDRVSQSAQMKYEYNSEDNTYVLVIRYNPIQAAVFSNRFEKSSEWKADYKEHTVDVWGEDSLKDPLLVGDWTFPEWNYRVRAPRTFWYD